MSAGTMNLEDSLKLLRQSVQNLEKVCVERENDLKSRQQDLFGGAAVEGKDGEVITLDMTKLSKTLDKTITKVERILKEAS